MLLTDNTVGAGHLTVAECHRDHRRHPQHRRNRHHQHNRRLLQKTVVVTAHRHAGERAAEIQALGFGVAVCPGKRRIGAELQASVLHGLQFRHRRARRHRRRQRRKLTTQKLVEAQDAAVFYGGGSGRQVTADHLRYEPNRHVDSRRHIAVTGVSNGPVTLNVSQDPSEIVKQLQSFTNTFNALVKQLGTDTEFDTTQAIRAVCCLGDATAQQIQSQLYVPLQSSVEGAGKYQAIERHRHHHRGQSTARASIKANFRPRLPRTRPTSKRCSLRRRRAWAPSSIKARPS